MAAPVGNRFWEQRSSHGRKPKFESPEDLWDAACEYFEWVEDNPLHESKAFAYQGEVTVEELPRMRAMTITGLCLFLDISRQGWSEYCAKEDFPDITKQIEAVIFSQKFEGAAADLLNANIIARELGLADKQEVTGKDGSPFQSENVTQVTVSPELVRQVLDELEGKY